MPPFPGERSRAASQVPPQSLPRYRGHPCPKPIQDNNCLAVLAATSNSIKNKHLQDVAMPQKENEKKLAFYLVL